jgi:hypothetical protein
MTTLNVPMGQSWLLTDLFCGGDTGTYSLNIDVYPQANFTYIMDSEYNGAINKNITCALNEVRIPVTGPAQIIAQITGDNANPVDIMVKYTTTGGPTN